MVEPYRAFALKDRVPETLGDHGAKPESDLPWLLSISKQRHRERTAALPVTIPKVCHGKNRRQHANTRNNCAFPNGDRNRNHERRCLTSKFERPVGRVLKRPRKVRARHSRSACALSMTSPGIRRQDESPKSSRCWNLIAGCVSQTALTPRRYVIEWDSGGDWGIPGWPGLIISAPYKLGPLIQHTRAPERALPSPVAGHIQCEYGVRKSRWNRCRMSKGREVGENGSLSVKYTNPES